ncbi:extracellular solute-binding protein [Pararoseomonas indoligenes]|uniref:Extracellular solute-binding protein n=1 Tax=Roseomonas indoligenes TaxID=2820811 RepID=A0A940N3Z4_9PROT|nr:extracellular solute-binding protein [Pararoseomonas indoligenes]MBP0496350.1 extracellular solute-binding protein [Pararoseomonas indoligenes]
MILPRRSVLAAGAALLAAPSIVRAQSGGGRVVMAAWGGAGAKMWREAFGEPFTKASGIPVTIAEVPDPAAVIAAAQGRPQHNVMLAASFQAAHLAQRGLIEELTEEDLPNLRHVPQQYWVRNLQGRILGMPIYFIYYGIAFNNTLAKASDFPSWEALTDRKWRGQLSLARPIFLGPYDLTLYAKLKGGNEANIQPGIPMLEAVARNAISVYPSMASVQQQLSRGEVTACAFYSGQIQMLRKAGQTEVEHVLPKEGGLVLSYIISVPKNAPDRAAAIRFLNDSVDPAKQVRAARDGYIPLSTNVTLPEDVVREIGMSAEEVRARNWSPDWYTIAADAEGRTRLAEQIADRAR